VGDGVTDDTAAIQAALDHAHTVTTTKGLSSSSSNMIVSAFPAPIVFFPAGVYKISSELQVNAARIVIKGERSILSTIVDGVLPSDFIIRFNDGFNTTVEDMVFASTENGAVIVSAPNATPAMMTFTNCEFMGHATEGGMGLHYINQSSHLLIDNCKFNDVAYAFYNSENISTGVEGADSVDIRDCQFSLNFTLPRDDDSGYIRLAKGKVTVEKCLFSGGPATGAYANKRIAFFKCDGTSSRTDLVIRDSRIAFEPGSATLINWAQPFNTATSGSSMLRGGFTISDCTFAPRGEDITYGTATPATPVIRLYEMPNRMWIVNNNSQSVYIGWIVANSTTSNDTLYNYAQPYILEDSAELNRALCSYRIENNLGVRTELIPTTTSQEYAKWLYLFNAFDFAFINSTENPDVEWTALGVNTFYSGDFLDAGLFNVSGVFTHSSTGVKYPRRWIVRVVKDTTAGTYSFLTHSDDDGAAVDGQSMTLAPKFVDSSGTATTTVLDSVDLEDYYLQLVLTPNSGSFSLYPLYVKPLNHDDIITGTNAGIAQYRMSYN
jgi:hypothetical protein